MADSDFPKVLTGETNLSYFNNAVLRTEVNLKDFVEVSVSDKRPLNCSLE